MAQWKVAEGHFEQDPIRIHFRDDIEVDKRFSVCARITWHASDRDEHGMPIRQELEQIDEYNKKLQAALESHDLGVLTMVLISDGECQWLFYIEDVARFESIIHESLKEEGVYPIEARVDEDPEWALYEQLKTGIQNAPLPTQAR